MKAPSIGLCATCEHDRQISNDRGSVFHLCGRAKDDPSYRKYPPLPVLRCAGYDPVPNPNSDASANE